MSAPIELFVLTWGVYPRRVLLYLYEKGLAPSPLIKITAAHPNEEGKIVAEGKPTGTVPILRLPDGKFLKQSIAILDYFENVCDNPDPRQSWQVQLAKLASSGSMRGNSHEEQAMTREMLSLADESTSQFVFACHKGSKLYMPFETTNAIAGKLALEYCKRDLKLLDSYYATKKQLDSGRQPNIADCVLYSLLHYAKGLYDIDLCCEPELQHLRQFYKGFGSRKTAQVEDDHFPKDIKCLASQWLVEASV